MLSIVSFPLLFLDVLTATETMGENYALVMAQNLLCCSLSSMAVAFTNGRHKKALPTTYCCISSATRRIPDYVPKRRPDAVPDPPPGVPCTVHATVRVSDELAPSEFFFSH